MLTPSSRRLIWLGYYPDFHDGDARPLLFSSSCAKRCTQKTDFSFLAAINARSQNLNMLSRSSGTIRTTGLAQLEAGLSHLRNRTTGGD